MPNSIYLKPSAGNPAVIKSGTACYMLVGPSSENSKGSGVFDWRRPKQGRRWIGKIRQSMATSFNICEENKQRQPPIFNLRCEPVEYRSGNETG